jgi:hypothetical protein
LLKIVKRCCQPSALNNFVEREKEKYLIDYRLDVIRLIGRIGRSMVLYPPILPAQIATF